MGVVLKELKECRTALKIIRKKEMIKPINKISDIFRGALKVWRQAIKFLN